MKKRRITLNLDEDIIETLEGMDARSVSAAANDVLREAVEDAAHRLALLRWLDELDAKYGEPPADEAQAIKKAVASAIQDLEGVMADGHDQRGAA